MNTITKLVLYAIVLLSFATIEAQTTAVDSIKSKELDYKISKLEAEKAKIEDQEKAILKLKISKINKQLDDKEITASEAEDLKKEAARVAALNIETRLEIIDGKIELLRRNAFDDYQYKRDDDYERLYINIGSKGLHFDINNNEKVRSPIYYDIRTTNKLLFAIGFNNAIADGQGLDDTPYKLGGSGFVELGWVWQTRLFKHSNFARLNYGFSFQWNKLKIKDNQYFVQDGDETTLQEFPYNLKKAKFRVTNLVFPVHFEFGPSKRRDYSDRIRYTIDDQFRIGIGGYGGVRLGTQQKLLFEDEEGNRVKHKEKRNFNASNFVYGLSAYVGFGDWSLYAKYDLNPLFKDQTVDQNNISLGLRFDLD